MADSLQLPEFLPDGSTLMMDADFMRRLHEGDASLGWVGDERLGVYLNNGFVEICRLCEDGVTRPVMRTRGRELNAKALRYLAEHDSQSRRQYSVSEDIDSHNARIERDRAAAAAARAEEVADRLEHALRKDIGAHIGMTSKRHF